MNVRRKILRHDKVEVRQLEEGLRGSWHSGEVVGVSESCREVKYDELLSESGKAKLVEAIPVTGAIEGLYQRPCVKSNYRGRIRPIPPVSDPCLNCDLKFGVCVDVLFKEAWWEGVIFDSEEGSTERRIYFPDEGDERIFKSSHIRLTLEWDEFSGNWRERGVWVLVNLAREHKESGHLFQLIRRVWSRLKVHYGFQKMISEWTCGAYCVWKEYFKEVFSEITTQPRVQGRVLATAAHRYVGKKRGRKPKRGAGSILTRSMQKNKGIEVPLAVRTRFMCLSDPENSPISAGTKARHSTDYQCRHIKFAATGASKNTETAKADEKGECDQAASACYVNINGCALEKEESGYGRTAQSDSLHARNSCFLQSNLNISRKKRFRRKWKFTPRKLKPFKIVSHKLERHAFSGLKMNRHISDNLRTPVLDNEPVDKTKELMLTQNNIGFQTRYPVLRQGGKRKVYRRSIGKKRSPCRIKKLSSRKLEKAKDRLKPIMPIELEAPKPSQKEEDALDNHCEGSLPTCQEGKPVDKPESPHKQKSKKSRWRDSVCFVCQYGDDSDELLHCDLCMSSYHLSCVDLEEVTVGESLCPSCRCGLCGFAESASDDQQFTGVCYQCSRQYHVVCLDKAGVSFSEDTNSDKFCSRSCFEICARLHQLLQISNPTSVEGLTWTITRSRRNDCNVFNERVHPLIQVSQVLNVFHECFQPIIEPHTSNDLVADIVYNSGSKFRRLDFHGFYVMALVKGEDLACVATIRIHGKKVAEMPLVATPFKYRRQGMCRLLVHELGKMLVEMGVERLVLPGIAQLSETWVSSFGFTEMPASLRGEFLGYPFVVFQGTTMFQKILSQSVTGETGLVTGSTEASECMRPVMRDCGGVEQVDKIGRALRPITQTYSRKKKLNRELANLKSKIDYVGLNRESKELDRGELESSQENSSQGRFSLCYQRKKRKVKAKVDGFDKNQPTYKCVYKRRRIQASKIL